MLNIAHDKLNMRRVCACGIPKMLTDGQKRMCIEYAQWYWGDLNARDQRIDTVDETWIRLKTPQTKQQSTMLVDTESVSYSMGNMLKTIVPG